MAKHKGYTIRPWVLAGIIVLLVFSLCLNGYFLYLHFKRQTVVNVHDGDTFTLSDGQRVRLLGVDAPELGNCFSDNAKQALSSLVVGKRVRITEEKRDMYGRRMGLVYIGNVLVNDEMLRNGYARPDYTPNTQSVRLKDSYSYAKIHALGIHSPLCKQISPTPPSNNCVIKGNIDKATGEHFYHLPGCRHYAQIILDMDTGEGFFCSEREASSAGFRLAPDCLR